MNIYLNSKEVIHVEWIVALCIPEFMFYIFDVTLANTMVVDVEEKKN